MSRLAAILQNNAEVCPDSVGWIERGVDGSMREISWRDLWIATLGMAHFLRTHGVESQSRVVQWGRNSLEWVLIELACSYCNAIHVPLDRRLSTIQASELCTRVEPTLILQNPDDKNRLLGAMSVPSFDVAIRNTISGERNWTSCSEVDIANILFTSGTSSEPKGVMLSHRALIANAQGKLNAMPQFRDDHRLNILPFAHAYAKTCELCAWLLSQSSMELAANVEELVQRLPIARPSLVNAVPSIYAMISERSQQDSFDPKCLRRMFGDQIRQLASGGAPMSDLLRARYSEAELPIFQGYGLTEAGPVVCSNRAARNAESTPILDEVGPPIDGVDIRIDSKGTLWARSDGIMLGYWRDPKRTEDRIINGWLDTGDMAEIMSNGSVKILGRNDDTIVLANGYKIQPLPVERKVYQIPFVRDCVLFQAGDRLKLVVAMQNGTLGGKGGHFEEAIHNAISELLGRQRVSIQLVEQEWSQEEGLRNFKGSPIRAALMAKYS